jgi:hypothetical protein
VKAEDNTQGLITTSTRNVLHAGERDSGFLKWIQNHRQSGPGGSRLSER